MPEINVIEKNKLICKECKEVASEMTYKFKTEMSYQPFIENGISHLHDNNTEIAGLKCSNGHEWSGQILHRCNCGWIQKEEEDIKGELICTWKTKEDINE